MSSRTKSGTKSSDEWTVNDMPKKLSMPRTRKAFEMAVINAFLAGCSPGYAVEHTVSVGEQEMLGALAWIGEITYEEAQRKMDELRNGGE